MIFLKVIVILNDDNTLSAGEIKQKLEEQRIRVSNSSVTRALKTENTITKTECWNNAFKWCQEECKKKVSPKLY